MNGAEKRTVTIKALEVGAAEIIRAQAKKRGETQGTWLSRLCYEATAQDAGAPLDGGQPNNPVLDLLRRIDERTARTAERVNSAERQLARMAADIADLRLRMLELREQVGHEVFKDEA